MSSDPFAEVLPLCRKSNELIQQVFTNPDLVMSKLVQNIFLTKLQVCFMYVLCKNCEQMLPFDC